VLGYPLIGDFITFRKMTHLGLGMVVTSKSTIEFESQEQH